MNSSKIDFFKNKLLQIKSQIINSGALGKTEDIAIVSEGDDADLASSAIEQQVSLTIRDKEFGKLRAIDEALYKIDEGEFGCCEDCGDPIAVKRLEFQPWAKLCIVHAEEQERANSHRKAF